MVHVIAKVGTKLLILLVGLLHKDVTEFEVLVVCISEKLLRLIIAHVDGGATRPHTDHKVSIRILPVVHLCMLETKIAVLDLAKGLITEVARKYVF